MANGKDDEYERFRDAGADVAAVYERAKANGVSRIACYALLRRLFDLSLAQAKSTMLTADQGLDLKEHQERFVDGLEEALEDEA
jgi:hypothetical protein